MKITSTEENIKKILMPLYIEVNGSIVEHLEKMFVELFSQALTKREEEIRKEIEGMRIYDIDDTSLTPIAMHGYNKAISDILLRLLQGGIKK